MWYAIFVKKLKSANFSYRYITQTIIQYTLAQFHLFTSNNFLDLFLSHG